MFLYDFDGVLISSVKEASLSGLNAVNKTSLRSFDQMPAGYFDLFFNNVFHFFNPYTLCVLARWSNENCGTNQDKILTREEFATYAAKQTDIDPKTIVEYFYSIRVAFMESASEEWLKLNEPFNPLWNTLIEYGSENVVILTAKNQKAVLKLCHHYAGDNNVSKIENFKRINERFKKEKYTFIDDHLKNLKDLNTAFNKGDEKPIDLVLCDWGYGSIDDYPHALELGFEVLGQRELIAKF